MNLHAIASPVISAVNPMLPAALQVSTGFATNPDSTRTPLYATPGTITASIDGEVLTVTNVGVSNGGNVGTVQVGQTLTDLSGDILPGTTIIAAGTGSGKAGTYTVNQPQEVSSETMYTVNLVPAQVQSLTYRDLAQIEGLNLNGERRAIYLYGRSDGVNRYLVKGGDLITIGYGPAFGVWLVAQKLEQWPDWVKVAATFQDQAPVGSGLPFPSPNPWYPQGGF